MKIIIAIVMCLIAFPCYAEKHSDGQGHIVHDKALPVILHKAVPPFKGVHLYRKPKR